MPFELSSIYAEVFIDTNASAVDSIYDYLLPPELSSFVVPGMRVVVPFGSSRRTFQALVVRLKDSCGFDPSRVKSIISVLDAEPAVPAYLIETAVFMRNRYFCTYSEALNTVLPSADKIKKMVSYRALTPPTGSDEAKNAVYLLIEEAKKASLAQLKIKSGLSENEVRRALSLLLKDKCVETITEFESEYKSPTDCYIEIIYKQNSLEDHLMQINPRANKQAEVLRCLFANGLSMKKSELIELTGAAGATLKPLTELGLIASVQRKRDFINEKNELAVKQELNEDQQKALKEYFSALDAGKDSFLLFGVTGSGKTRVYFEMFDKMLEMGKQCLLLVPEIALTPQMMELVSRRFSCSVAIMHSKLTPAQRYAEFLKIKKGEAGIVLGARSALFMPFHSLGIIVIDEEHETSYKSSQSPKYDSIEVASFIKEKTGAVLVLASATPQSSTFYKAMQGEYSLLRLPKRAAGNALPTVTICDMRDELKSGNRSPLSRLLKNKITERLEAHQQVLLFLNRRGFSTYVFCRSCGYKVMCPNCEVTLTYHHSSGKLMCHYCGHSAPTPNVCPECGSEKIKFMGTGTEKIEEYVRSLYPYARVIRLDSDVAKGKDAYERILKSFSSGEADILIGTQMIVKGLDFADVTLTGILLADASLNFPDINAASRTYQLTSQAAGRSGRRQTQGEVVVQSYTPDAPALCYSAMHDYEGFYAYDITHKKRMNYPPFTEILGIFVANESDESACSECETVFERLKKVLEESGCEGVRLYSPAPAYIQKLKNKYIYHTLILYPSGSAFPTFLRERYAQIKKKLTSSVFTEINPVTLL